MLAEIFRRIGVAGGGFVEFGASDGAENNAAFLAQVLGWPGVFLEADPGAFSALEHRYRGHRGCGPCKPPSSRHDRGAAARCGSSTGARPARDRRRRQRLLDLARTGGVPTAGRGDRVQRRPRPDGAEGHAVRPRLALGPHERLRGVAGGARGARRRQGLPAGAHRARGRERVLRARRARGPAARRRRGSAPQRDPRCSVTATGRRGTSPSGSPGREGAATRRWTHCGRSRRCRCSSSTRSASTPAAPRKAT